MTRVAYFDCPSGASGDMLLGALVDAGCPLAALEAALATLGIAGFTLAAREVTRGGLRASQLVVETDPAVRFDDLAAMLAPLGRSQLSERSRTRAAAVLRRLAEAEARVHRVAAAAVHFHEVGELDTLVDVVGAVVALETLAVDDVVFSSLPVGGGWVEGAHGRLPVPAPATAELLRGCPLHDNGVRAELVTPTGAAILTTLGTPGPVPPMALVEVGYGAGRRDFPGMPNLLRVMIGEATGRGPWERDTVVVIEATVDDMTPQLWEPVIERLLAAGALDAFLVPVIMKRSRPGAVLTVLARPGEETALQTVVFEETTTIGLRSTRVDRAVLGREAVRLATSFGEVTFKVSRLGGRAVTVTPEFEEVRQRARQLGRPVREVLEAVRAEGRHLLAGPAAPPGDG